MKKTENALRIISHLTKPPEIADRPYKFSMLYPDRPSLYLYLTLRPALYLTLRLTSPFSPPSIP